MNNTFKNLLIVIVGGAVIFGVYFYWNNLRGIGPAINKPSGNIAEQLDDSAKPGNKTGMPLTLPEGFSIEVFAKDLTGARVLAQDEYGDLWLSRTSEGIVSHLFVKDGQVSERDDLFKNLRKPHGIAVYPPDTNVIYIAEEHRISKIRLNSNEGFQTIADLPAQGGGHFTRTLGFGPDGRLYVSIGSSCNVCDESDPRRASIYSMNADGSDFKKFASGLRNTVFFTWHPKSNQMWGTDMGRDLLGDNLPPEEINIVEEGKNYGWPNCYGNNIHDEKFDKKIYIRNPCSEPFETAPRVEMQAHSAPLGLAFVPENSNWPKEYWNDLIVAFHGSWNRSVPTGYKLVRVKLDDKGNYEGIEDFITGWLQGSSALGRPVDILIQSDGTMYVSDDKAGVVYKVQYAGK